MSAWNEILKGAVTSAGQYSQELGKPLSIMLEAFWPQDEPSIWAQVCAQVSELFDQEIFQYEYRQRSVDIEALKLSIRQYIWAQEYEKGKLLNVVINDCNQLYYNLNASTNRKQIIPLLVITANIHVTALSERLSFGELLYDKDEHLLWAEALETGYQGYVTALEELVPQWREWRFAKITARAYTRGFTILPELVAEVTDSMALQDSERRQFSTVRSAESHSEDYFRPAVNAIKKLWSSYLNAQMLYSLVSIFELRKMVTPLHNSPVDGNNALRNFTVGPISSTTLGFPEFFNCDTTTQGRKGSIAEVVVREYNSIDGLQMGFRDRPGRFFGSADCGIEHHLQPPQGCYFDGMALDFSRYQDNNILCQLQLLHSDGTRSDELGNRAGGPTYSTQIKALEGFRLSGINANVTWGSSNTTGINVIELHFTYSDVFEDETELREVAVQREIVEQCEVIEPQRLARHVQNFSTSQNPLNKATTNPSSPDRD